MSSIGLIAIGMTIFLAPLIFLLIYRIWWVNRSTKEAERDASPFDPSPESPPGALIRRFTLPQRVYLRQQLKLSAVVYLLLGWGYLLILSLPLFVLSLPFFTHGATANHWFNPSALFWLQFLRVEVTFVHILGSASFVTVLLAMTPLRIGAEARYYRTRPLSIGFLFWARYLPLFVALIAATATSIAIAYGLVFALKGPIWQHLPVAIPRTLGPDDAQAVQDYRNLLATSVSQIILSTLTSVVMFFSVALVVATIPFNRRIRNGAFVLFPIFIVGCVGPSLWNLFSILYRAHLPRVLFIYDYLGPPSPYVFSLIPIALSIVCIAFARHFVTRLEV